MAATLLRLLTLTALLLMPFTMVSAPAQAHHDQGGAMPAAHQADHDAMHGGGHDQPPPSAMDMSQCLLMCAALPAGEASPMAAPDLPRAPLILAAAKPINGIILEIATPPPRRA